MKILITKHFKRWFKKQQLTEKALINAVQEINDEIFDANLGGNLYKKRIATTGHGKRKSSRVIICFRKEKFAIFIYGFLKKEKDDLTENELKGLKELCKIFSNFSEEDLNIAIKNKILWEIKDEKEN